MPATMFTMGFGRSNFQPLPISLGLSFRDLQDQWKKYYEQVKDIRDVVKTGSGGASAPIPMPQPPPAESKILGLPASTALIGGAVLLGTGILAAVLLSGN